MIAGVRTTRRRVNRTLLDRQQLLARAEADVLQMLQHVVGLQAQETCRRASARPPGGAGR
jgi:hypothetical protein